MPRSSTSLSELLATDVLRAAPALLGATLVFGELRARIVETEAYRAQDDPACHAYRARTKRNEVMFGPPGRAYVYFNYGVHWMLNVTAHADGDAAAVLIRAAVPLAGLEVMSARRATDTPRNLLSGPGKLCKAFAITGELNGLDLFSPTPAADRLHILPSAAPLARSQILTGPRIGISQGQNLPWRYLDRSHLDWVSRPLPR